MMTHMPRRASLVLAVVCCALVLAAGCSVLDPQPDRTQFFVLSPMAEPAEYGAQYLAQFETYEAVWRHHADGRPKFHGIIDRLDAARYYLFDWSTVVRPA